jgi:hypothetical protein
MTRPSLDIVLESPLDDLPERRGLHPLLAFVMAAALGGLATVGAAAALGDDEAPVATSAPVTTVADTPDEIPTTLVLDDGTRIEQLRWWTDDDSLSVLVAATAPPGADPAETTPVISGYWELVLTDGRTVVGTASSDIGVSTIEFSAPGVEPAAAASLRFSRPVTTFEREVTWTEDAVGFPWRPAVDEPLAAADGAEIALDMVRFDDLGGEVSWRLESQGRHRATLDVEVTYQEEGRDERIVSRYGLPAAFLQLDPSDLRPITGETLELYHLDDPVEPTFRSRFWGDPDPVDVTNVTVTWTILIAGYSDEPFEAAVSIDS